ncbi:MAG: hypothetical protein K5739_05430 [Lachnospiraceae bacterium]|nr:hypothetical protein [Lachnospiraceae bacterium]
MAANFRISIKLLKELLSKLEEIERSLRKNRETLANVRNGISVGSGTHEIKALLAEEIERIDKQAEAVHQLKETLEDVIRLYEMAEATISGNYIEKLLVNVDKAVDNITDLSKENQDILREWIESNREKNASVVDRIEDEETRKGFSDDYRDTLQKHYDDVPPEYRNTRDLYDKYSKDVKVADFNAPGSKHNSGKLYLDSSADMSNKRGNGTTYYHEFGHFVVYKEGWVKGSETCGEFKDFEESLKKEVNEYIDGYEKKYREEGQNLGKTGDDLDDYITKQTKKAIKEDINGKNDEYHHVNDGLSDIIDGVSNDKYQASYGHDPDKKTGKSYWDTNPSRVSNEAFAEIFAAEMTGDTTEIEKMKEIFPETYKLYSDMVKDAK